MIVDTSALIAILAEEDDAQVFIDAIDRAEAVAISSMTFLETGIVLARRYIPDRTADFIAFLDAAGIETVAFTAAHAVRAPQKYRAHGKAFHAAALNFGDCAAYALAMERVSRSCSRVVISPKRTYQPSSVDSLAPPFLRKGGRPRKAA